MSAASARGPSLVDRNVVASERPNAPGCTSLEVATWVNWVLPADDAGGCALHP